MKSTHLAILAFAIVMALSIFFASQDRGGRPLPPPVPPVVTATSPQPEVVLPKVDQRLCTAVAILLDSSSSMKQDVRTKTGGKQPKYRIAREALERILTHTEEALRGKPDLHLELGIYQFSSDVEVLQPLRPFNAAEVRGNLGRIRPSTGTAIGRALEVGFRDLTASGCTRKHIVCITDGENTSGPSPDRIAGVFHQATGGEVAIHFVAFDIDARKFRFLERVNGRALEASDEAELQTQLTEIYDKRILAEAPLVEPTVETDK